jgi:hypothetical protein
VAGKVPCIGADLFLDPILIAGIEPLARNKVFRIESGAPVALFSLPRIP